MSGLDSLQGLVELHIEFIIVPAEGKQESFEPSFYMAEICKKIHHARRCRKCIDQVSCRAFIKASMSWIRCCCQASPPNLAAVASSKTVLGVCRGAGPQS